MPHRKGGLWIDRISREIPGFNERSLNLEDLYKRCDTHHMFISEMPMRRLHGCSFYDEDEQPCLLINSLLNEAERIVAGWHEFAHLLLHTPDGSVFCSTGNLWNHSKTEAQAQTIGVLALIPQTMLHEDLSGYPRKIVMYRHQVWQTLQM
jgi:Zn-dependent peptidase ImmA (M78 family)